MLFWTVICDLYFFHFTVLLNPDFSCFSFVSFSFDKVANGTYNFVSVIWNSNLVGGLYDTVISAKIQSFDQVKISSILQLINGIFKLFQKLLKCFSGVAASVSFLPTLTPS